MRAGDCRVLTSDYYYPALLQAPFALAARGVVSIEAAWALISTGPARAAGLEDRGRIEPGARADFAVLDDGNGPHVRVRAAYVAGERVYAA